MLRALGIDDSEINGAIARFRDNDCVALIEIVPTGGHAPAHKGKHHAR